MNGRIPLRFFVVTFAWSWVIWSPPAIDGFYAIEPGRDLHVGAGTDVPGVGAHGVPRYRRALRRGYPRCVLPRCARPRYGIMDTFKLDRTLLRAYDAPVLVAMLSALARVFGDRETPETIGRVGELHRESAGPGTASITGAPVQSR